MIDQETLHIIEIEIVPTIGIETIHLIEDINVARIDHAIFPIKDQTIEDQDIITIKIDHTTVHRTEVQVITTDKETNLNHHIGTTHVIQINNKIIKVVYINIKDK